MITKKSFDEYPRPTKDDEPVQIGDWKVLHVIGAGGMGLVFQGNDAVDTKAAIKIIKPDILSDEVARTFEFEISAQRLINSPYVAKLLDSSLTHDPAFMAIEFIHGKTLQKIIENRERISERSWFTYAKQIFLGLEQIHARGLVHRDIKPANIMKLEDKEMIKIIDLGLAKPEIRITSSNTSTFVGTPAYTSPEQMRGKSATQKSDIFSAGVTLIELFTKIHPFYSQDEMQDLHEGSMPNTTYLKGLSESQKSFVLKLLHDRPSERITASQAVALIDEYLLRSSRIVGLVKPKRKAEVLSSPKKEIIDPLLLGVVDEFKGAHKLEVKNIIKMGYGVPDLSDLEIKPNKIQNDSDKLDRRLYIHDLTTLMMINGIFLSYIDKNIFHINFYSTKFKSDVYFQGYVDAEGRLLVEAMSDEFLSIKFSQEQKDLLVNLGWTPPHSINPNYSIKLANNYAGTDFAAKIIAETAFSIYEATKETEIYLNPINEKITTAIKQDASINVASDGSFILSKEKSKINQYEKWQIIGYFEKDYENDMTLQTLVARQIENNRVYKRQNKAWKFIGIVDNPIKNGINKLKAKNGLVFDKKIINIFDKTEAEKELLTFEGTCHFLDYVPNLSAKYKDQEKIWPLTDDMIQLGSDTASEFDDFLGLFTLSSSNVNRNVVVGLFAKHPQTQNFYGRSQGKWKLLFESPLSYGHEIFFVTKDFIDFYDKRSKNPEKPVKHKELEDFLHNPVFD